MLRRFCRELEIWISHGDAEDAEMSKKALLKNQVFVYESSPVISICIEIIAFELHLHCKKPGF